MLFLKNLLFTVFIPGTVTLLLPYEIVSQSPENLPEVWRAPQWAALLPALLGVAIYLWCLWDFATFGRGTPAPIDPPKRLVVRGLYRYMRNPMYVGVLSILLAEAAFFESWWLLAYASFVFTVFHLFIVLYEEPVLSRQFGESYQAYRQSVRHWLPGTGR